jgi:uncharacterized membrane protein
VVAGSIGLVLSLYIAYRASVSERQLFSVSLLALFAGLLPVKASKRFSPRILQAHCQVTHGQAQTENWIKSI